MDRCEEFIKEVCSYIKNKDVHEEIKEEIRGHILEIKDEFIQDGMKEEEAIDKAVDRMGDSFEIGQKLNKVHKSGPDIISIVITSILLLIGIITMYSLKSDNIISQNIIKNNLVYAAIGITLGFFVYFFDYRKIQKYSFVIYIVGIVLSINAIFFSMPIELQIAKIATFNFSISLSMQLLVPIVFLVGMCGILENTSKYNFKNYFKVVVMMIFPCIFLIPLGVTSFALYGIVMTIMILCSNFKRLIKISFVIAELFMSFIFVFPIIFNAPYRMARLTSIINPYRDSEGSGWLVINIRKSLSALKLIGSGRNNIQIPSLGNDLVLVYILQTFGIVIGVICLVAILLLLIRSYKNALRIKNSYGKKLLITITSIITVEFVSSILYNLSFCMISYSIPFLSSGASSLMINTFLIGIMCSIYKRKDLSFKYKINKII